MKDRAFVFNGVLAAVAVVAAGFAAYGPSGESGEEAVVVVPGSNEQLTALEWREGGYEVRVSRGEKGAPVRVSVKREVAAPAQEPSSGDSARVFPGTERASTLLREVFPLQAARRLGQVEPEQLESLGLKEPAATLVLHVGGEAKEVKVGNATYGSGDRYGTLDDREIFLLEAKTVAPLRSGATTLLERRALPVEPKDVKRARITSGGQSRDLIRRHGEDATKAFYADPAVPDERLDQITNWMDRVLKLRLGDVASAPPSGTPQVEIEVASAEGSLGKVSIWPVQNAEAVLVSSFFSQPMTLAKANAEAVLRDVQSMMEEGK